MKLSWSILMFILLDGCGVPVIHPTVYVPAKTDGVRCYYQDGVPFAALEFDSSKVSVSLEGGMMIGLRRYFRLWVVYENQASGPHPLEPLAAFQLDGENAGPMMPEPPSVILSFIDTQERLEKASASVGGAFDELTARPTIEEPEPNMEPFIPPKDPKRREVHREANANLDSLSAWYATFREGVNNRVLRKSTVFSHQSVYGFVYFRSPNSVKEDDVRGVTPHDGNQSCVLKLRTQDGYRQIEFTPVVGE
jgi:hypothetical protein